MAANNPRTSRDKKYFTPLYGHRVIEPNDKGEVLERKLNPNLPQTPQSSATATKLLPKKKK